LTEELQERLESDRLRNNREANLLIVHVTNQAGTFSKSTSITKYCAKKFVEQSMELLKAFNKSSKYDETWKPGILTLGLSASKFTDLDKPKTNNNPLLKYFNNETKPSTSAETNLDDSNKEEDTKYNDPPEKSNSKNSSELLSNELTALSNNSNIFNVIEPTTSKTAAQLDESDLDADLNFENSNDNLIDSKLTDTKIFFKNKTSPSEEIELSTVVSYESAKESILVDDIDYVKCEKCGKKILAWEFPEHEDFHYAQDLSKQFCVSAPQTVPTAPKTDIPNNKKKRSLTEEAGKNSHNDQNTSEPATSKRAPAKSKKIKIEINAKPINNYFKKL